MNRLIFLEGGSGPRDRKCAEGFHKLLKSCGFARRMPRLIPCGGRGIAFDDFKTALANKRDDDFVALWIDSEDPVKDIEATWEHLKARDGWDRPEGATNEQVLLMTTCMETLIVADRETLAEHYGAKLQKSALPALKDLEGRSRHAIQEALAHATRKCSNAYTKGKRSFEILGKLDPETLGKHLPSFVRVRRILEDAL